MGQAQEDEGDDKNIEDGKHKLSLQMSNALRTVNDLWKRNPTAWSVARDNFRNSNVNVSQMKKSAFPRRHEQRRKEPDSAQCAAYIHLKKASITAWWKKVRSGPTPPTVEQSHFMEFVIARCEKRATGATEIACAQKDSRLEGTNRASSLCVTWHSWSR